MQKYDNLFENNAKNGSFYLQSKVHRAKECLEAVQQGKSQGTPSWELRFSPFYNHCVIIFASKFVLYYLRNQKFLK